MSKISVVLSNYNDAATLPRALAAICTQLRCPDEVVVIDDASGDDSVAIINSIQKKYPIIKVVINKKNRGAVASANSVLAQLKGDYVYWASANDWISPDFFQNALKMAEAYPKAGTIFGQMAVVDKKNKVLYVGGSSLWHKTIYASPQKYLDEFLRQEAPTHSLSSSLIYSREKLIEVGGFRPELYVWSDTFAARMLGLRWGVVYVPEVWSYWTMSNKSMSWRHSQEQTKALRTAQVMARLMLLTEFADFVPRSYVKNWLLCYRRQLILKKWVVFIGLYRIIPSGWLVWMARRRKARIFSGIAINPENYK